MRILIVTDAWTPQVNGVVRTLQRVTAECEAMGHRVEIIAPSDGFFTIPLPSYSEIRLALGAKREIERRIRAFEPDAIHIATEGTLGWAARSICMKWDWPFTTSYHTQFPEYVNARAPFIPVSAGYWVMRRFHRFSGRVMVATQTMRSTLEGRRFRNIVAWTRGVDTELFHPRLRDVDTGPYAGMERPIWLNVGRVAVEKNIEAFLKLDLPGTKIVVGDGPQRDELVTAYPDAHFLGAKFGDELARLFADADVFVFPSLTDTFGLVILEAMATGTPVAAYPAPGPADIIPGSNAGVISEDLEAAAKACLDIDRDVARAYAERFSWRSCAQEFLRNLEVPPLPSRRRFWRALRKLGGGVTNVRLRLPGRKRRRDGEGRGDVRR